MTGFTDTYFTSCQLIKIEWNNGMVYRYCSTLGFINYLGEVYLDSDDIQGQIISIGDYSEKSGEISNLDITLTQKIGLQTILNAGNHEYAKVTIIEGNNYDNFVPFKTTTWRIMAIDNDGGLDKTVTLVLSNEALGNMLNKGDTPTYSVESQKYIIGTTITDTGFRYISDAAKA